MAKDTDKVSDPVASVAPSLVSNGRGAVATFTRAVLWTTLLSASILVSNPLTGLPGGIANLAWFLIGLGLAVRGRVRRYVLAACALVVVFAAASLEFRALGAAKIAAVGVIVLVHDFVAANISLLPRLRATGRKPGHVAFMTLRRWSLLAIFVVLGVIAWKETGELSDRLVLESTPLDSWCDVQGLKEARRIPCTEITTLAPADTVEIGLDRDIDRFVLEHFQSARVDILSMSPERLREVSSDPGQSWQEIDPARILGLERSVTYEPEMLSLARAYNAHKRAEPERWIERHCGHDNDFDCSYQNPAWGTWSQEKSAMQATLTERRKEIWEMRIAGLTDSQRELAARRDALSEKLTEQAKKFELDPKALRPETGEEDRQELYRLAAVRALADSERATLKYLKEFALAQGSTVLVDLGAKPGCTVAKALQEGENNQGIFDCIDSGERTSALRLVALSFRESVLFSLDRMHSDAVLAADADLLLRDDQIERGGEQAKEAVQGLTDLVPTQIHLSRREYGGAKFLNRFVNRAIGIVEDAYRTARAILAANVKERTNIAVSKGELSAKQQVDEVRSAMDARLESARAEIRDIVKVSFVLGDWWTAVGWVTLILVVLKSWAHVAGLELFHSNEKLTISLDSGSTAEGTTRIGDPSLVISPSFQQSMLTSRLLGNSTHTKRLRPPWPAWAILSRVLRLKYFSFFTSQYLPGAGSQGMNVGSDQPGKAVVEWAMVEGEEVVFDLSDFFGASENIDIRTEFSFQLGTLLLGRIRFHYAKCLRGEGRLLLIARVDNIPQDQLHAIPVEQLVAWNRHMRFTAHSHRTAWGTLINGFTLVRHNQPGRNSGVWVTAPAAVPRWGIVHYARQLFSSLK